MGLQNKLICGVNNGGNTGFGECVVDIGLIMGILFVPKNTEFALTDLATLKTALEAAILNDVPSERIYPVQGFVALTDNSEDLTIQTFGYGGKQVVREGDIDLTFQFVDGAFCLNYNLRKANGLNKHFFLIDKNGKLIGTQGSAADTLKAITPSLQWTPPFKLNDGSAVTMYSTRVSFSPSQINENISFVDFNDAAGTGGYAYLASLAGLQNIALAKISRAVAVLKVSAKTACGTVDLYDLYADDLADEALWVANKDVAGVPGAVLTITSVAKDDNAKGWTVTIDTEDPDYSIGAPIWIKLAGPTTLEPVLGGGYESNNISVAV